MPTLYNWRNESRRKGILLPVGDSGPEGWIGRDKFTAVLKNAEIYWGDETGSRNDSNHRIGYTPKGKP